MGAATDVAWPTRRSRPDHGGLHLVAEGIVLTASVIGSFASWREMGRLENSSTMVFWAGLGGGEGTVNRFGFCGQSEFEYPSK
jgi:hypothetical protein